MSSGGEPPRRSLADQLIELSPQGADPDSEAWAHAFAQHAHKARRMRRLMRMLPSDPRCKLCHAPFRGMGGRVLRFTGHRASRKSPHLCNECVEEGPAGGFEAEVGILFADVRGFTSFAETRSPTESAKALERFYEVAGRAIIRHEGILDKLVGDEVMALYWPIVMDEEPCAAMVGSANDVLDGVGYGAGDEPWLPVGIGLDFGRAYVGNIGGGEARDFTALGDVVNTAARLQGQASAGEIVMTDRVYAAVSERHPGALRSEVSLKGKSAPTPIYRFQRVVAAASV